MTSLSSSARGTSFGDFGEEHGACEEGLKRPRQEPILTKPRSGVLVRSFLLLWAVQHRWLHFKSTVFVYQAPFPYKLYGLITHKFKVTQGLSLRCV